MNNRLDESTKARAKKLLAENVPQSEVARRLYIGRSSVILLDKERRAEQSEKGLQAKQSR